MVEDIAAVACAQFHNYVDGTAVDQLHSATLHDSNLRSQNPQPQCRQTGD
jgi:hypothetical protein